MISSFCKFYHYKFDEVLLMPSRIFFEMYDNMTVIQDERDLELLNITENKLWLESKDTSNYSEIYTRKRKSLEKVIQIKKKYSSLDDLKAMKERYNK